MGLKIQDYLFLINYLEELIKVMPYVICLCTRCINGISINEEDDIECTTNNKIIKRTQRKRTCSEYSPIKRSVI